MKTSSNNLFIELAHDTYHSANQVVPFRREELSSFRGFRSVYLYGQDCFDFIQSQGAVKGLGKYSVYSDMLFIDFDDGDNSIEKMKRILNAQDLQWEMYFSGGKGYHFHVPITPMVGRHVPHSQREFIRGLGIDTADISIYKHTGFIRLPGTWHQSTGKQKELIESSNGSKILTIKQVEPDVVMDNVVEGSELELLAGLNRAVDFVVKEPYPGTRHSCLLAIAKHLFAAGAKQETVWDICNLVHETWEEKYDNPEEKIEEAISRAAEWNSYINRPGQPPHGSGFI